MEKEMIVKVEGMKCTGCEATIRKRLLKVKNVVDARANFKNGLVQLHVQNGFQVSEADDALQELGYVAKKYLDNSSE